jgi:hypothetical protein
MATKYQKMMKGAGGYRSKLEKRIADDLLSRKVNFTYERDVIKWTKPETYHRYTPDFVLPNGIIIEAKGLFESKDRKKHLYIQAEHPHLDIRFVFSSPQSKIYKGSKTTYADWCNKHGFKYAMKLIPKEWINETRQ